MSMACCSSCSYISDTDADVEFYNFTYRFDGMGGHCARCRCDMMEKMTDAQIDAHEKRIYGQ